MAAPEVALQETIPKSGIAGWIERIDDRMNPILVREVRQGLRGNTFRNLFWLTLVLATMICGFAMSMRVIDGDEGGNGRTFFGITMGLLRLATGYFVPFVAFQSVSAEWEERTRDLLQLSGLGSWAIVRGKLVAALVQAGLFYFAFLPFIAFAFLLRGLDLQQILVELNVSLANCLVATTLAILLASLGRTRTMRVFLFATLAVVLLFWSGLSSAFSSMGAFSRLGGRPTLSVETVFFPWLTAMVPVAYGISFARNRFAHEYENQSTPLRILTTLISVGLLPVVAFLNWSFGSSGWALGGEAIVMMLFGLTCISLLFASEGETMSRRVAAHVPRLKRQALLSTPWLPGGGRGLLFYMLHAALILAMAYAVDALYFRMPSLTGNDYAGALAMALLGFLSIAVSTRMLQHERSSNNRRILAILVAFGIPFAGIMISGFGQLLFRHSRSVRPWDILSPPHVIDGLMNGRAGLGTLLALLGLAAFALAINTKRLWRSLAEIPAVAAANRARAAESSRLISGDAVLEVKEERT